jgi:uncharacterized protein YqgC (DUF456 family)
MTQIFALILSLILMTAGLAGVVLPFVPGIPLAWLGFFIYASVTGFKTISLAVVLIFLVLTIVLTALDFLGPVLGAKKYQASKWGIAGTFAGAILGIFTMGVWGIILGPFLGALAGEFLAGKGKKQAFKSALGAFLGFVIGTLIRLIIVLIMFGFLIASLI